MTPVSPRLLTTALLSVSTMALVPVLISSINVNEITIGLVRVLIACAALTPLLLFKKLLKGLTASDWLALLLIGVVFAVHWWTYFYAIKNTSASLGALSLATYGIHVLWINCLLKAQRPRLSELLAILLCFCGCIIVAPSLDLSSQAAQGFLVGVLSGLIYAVLPFLHQRVSHLPTTVRSWGQFGFAGLFFLCFWPQTHWQFEFADVWRLLVLGVVSTLIAHTLWVKATTELPAVLSGAFYYLYIPIAMLLSYIFLDEPMTFAKVFGAVLIVGSCLLGIFLPIMLRGKESRAGLGKSSR